jgi:hypothetical protein
MVIGAMAGARLASPPQAAEGGRQRGHLRYSPARDMARSPRNVGELTQQV